ncbi:MAG: hypothetical protein ACYTGX_06025 [Planctomycetota bacterium]|jgi:hypothetical protein
MNDAARESKPFPWKKVLLGCGCAGLLSVLLCAGGIWYTVANAYTLNPPEVVEHAKAILPGAELPEGYQGIVAAKIPFVGVRIAMLSPQGFTEGQKLESMACMLMAIPTTNAEQARMQMQQQVQQQTGQTGKHEVLDSETITVAGRERTLHKTRQTNPDGSALLQMMVLLPQGTSTVIAMFMGPEDTFDRNALDAFLASIPPQAE